MLKSKRFEIDTSKKVIFVEGASAKKFIENYVKKYDSVLFAACKFYAFQAGPEGFENLPHALSELTHAIKREPPRSLSLRIILDCEESEDLHRKNLVDQLAAAGLKLDETSTIEGATVTVTALFTPSTGQHAIESALVSAAKNNALLDCAERFADCVESQNPKSEEFAKINWRNKVIVHSLLATTDEPDAPIWRESTFNLWNRSHPEIERIFSFLRR